MNQSKTPIQKQSKEVKATTFAIAKLEEQLLNGGQQRKV